MKVLLGTSSTPVDAVDMCTTALNPTKLAQSAVSSAFLPSSNPMQEFDDAYAVGTIVTSTRWRAHFVTAKVYASSQRGGSII